jgi:hypothetical protein
MAALALAWPIVGVATAGLANNDVPGSSAGQVSVQVTPAAPATAPAAATCCG